MPEPNDHQSGAHSSRIPDAIRRVFLESFTARDIAEPIVSFDADASSSQVREFLESRDFDIVGVRRDGVVTGYVARDALKDEGTCGQWATPVASAVTRDEATPLLEVLLELNRAPFLFVRLLGAIGGIVTLTDLQKPAVRMWLFGIVTLIEMRFGELIEQHCPGDAWMSYVSESRLEKARALLAERARRNQALRLFDCLQFADKVTIISRNKDIRSHTIFTSRREAEETSKDVERLRDNLAHAQDILTSDWETIVRLCEFVAR